MSISIEAADIATSIEKAYQSVRQAAAAISILYARGAATCQDVKGYNLLALSIYNTQKAMLEGAIAAGVNVNGMTSPPTPTLFYWNGVAGKDAALVSCPSAGLSGVLGAAAPQFLPPNSLRIVTSDPAWQNPSPNIAAAQIARGVGLGAAELPVVVYILIASVSIAVAIALIEALTSAWSQHEVTRQIAVQVETKAQAAKDMWAARAGYIASCKGDAADCAAQAVKLFPEPDLSVQFPPPKNSGLGILAWAGVISLVGVGGALIYRKYHHANAE